VRLNSTKAAEIEHSVRLLLVGMVTHLWAIHLDELCRDYLQQRKLVEPDRWALPPQPWDELTPERLLASKRAIVALSKALDALPRGLCEVSLFKDVGGLESEEICERLHITETNLHMRLHRARAGTLGGGGGTRRQTAARCK
jgi:DNA-directed RNA polymerase specialized sigma24 family protein